MSCMCASVRVFVSKRVYVCLRARFSIPSTKPFLYSRFSSLIPSYPSPPPTLSYEFPLALIPFLPSPPFSSSIPSGRLHSHPTQSRHPRHSPVSECPYKYVLLPGDSVSFQSVSQ